MMCQEINWVPVSRPQAKTLGCEIRARFQGGNVYVFPLVYPRPGVAREEAVAEAQVRLAENISKYLPDLADRMKFTGFQLEDSQVFALGATPYDFDRFEI